MKAKTMMFLAVNEWGVEYLYNSGDGHGVVLLSKRSHAQDALDFCKVRGYTLVQSPLDTLVEALDLATATVELGTGNGARSNPPTWPRTKNGDVDVDAVAKRCRKVLRGLA